MSVLVVAGTDTGVGKTSSPPRSPPSRAPAASASPCVKPAQTGVGAGEPGDLDEVRRLTGVDDLHELARYPEPLAPATAARRAGRAGVSRRRDRRGGRASCDDRDLVLVEGAGGLLVRFDEDGGDARRRRARCSTRRCSSSRAPGSARSTTPR